MAGNGIKPSALSSPVANQDEKRQVAVAGMNAASNLEPQQAPPAIQAQGAQSVQQSDNSDMDAAFNAMNQEVSSADSDMDAAFAQHGGHEAQADQVVKNVGLGLRAKLSFAETPYEREAVLKEAFPDSKIQKYGDGDLDYKIKTKDGETLDLNKSEGWLDKAGQFLANHASTALGMGVGVLPEAAGIVAAPFSGGSSVMAGNVLAAEADKTARDATARALGVPLDPNRNLAQEHALNAAYGAAFGMLTKAVNNSIVDKYGAKAAQAIKDDLAFNSIKDTVVKALAPDHRLQQAGILPEGSRNLFAHEVAPTGDILAQEAQAIGTPGYNEAIRERGNRLAEGFSKLFNMIGDLGSSKANLGDKFQSHVDDLYKAEGDLIGKYRDQALKEAKNQSFQATNAKNSFNDIASRIGLKFDNDTQSLVLEGAGDVGMVKATPQSLANALIDGAVVNKETDARALSGALLRAGKALNTENGNIPLKEMQNLREFYKGFYRNIQKSDSGAYKSIIGNLERGFRNDMDEVASQFVSPIEKDAYNVAKAKFGVIADASEVLTKAIEQDNISAKALAKNIFSNGADGLDKIKAVRTLTESSNPQLWKDLVGQHLQSILDDSGGDFIKAANKLKKTDPEVLLEMANGNQQTAGMLKDMFSIASRVEKTVQRANNAEDLAKGIREFAHVGSKAMGGSPSAMAKIFLKLLGSNKKAQEYVEGKPLDYFLKGLPPSMQQQMQAPLSQAINQFMQSRAGDVVKRGAIHAIDPMLAQPTSQFIEDTKKGQ